MTRHTLLQTGVATLAALGLAAAMPVHAQTAFTPGDIVVSQVGNGTETLANTGNNVFIDEFNTGGVTVQSFNLSTAGTGTIYSSGTAGSEGILGLSANGQYLTYTGYASTGTTSIVSSTSASNNRVIADIGINGSIDKTTKLSDAFSGNNPRAAITTDGSTFYAVGANDGVRSAADGATTSSIVSSTTTNNRVINIYNGNLYYTTGSGSTRGIYQVGTGLPTGTGVTSTNILNLGNAASPYGFYITPDGLTAYVADSAVGVSKYTRTATTAAFGSTAAYTFANTTGITDLAGFAGPNGVSLYAVSPTSLFSIADSGTAFTGSAIAAAATGTAFRGVEYLAPAPEPSGIVALALGAGVLGLTAARRRKQMA